MFGIHDVLFLILLFHIYFLFACMLLKMVFFCEQTLSREQPKHIVGKYKSKTCQIQSIKYLADQTGFLILMPNYDLVIRNDVLG